MADRPMNLREAADKLAALLREIDDAGITVITEDEETIFLMRGSRRLDNHEFEEINIYSGKWKVVT